MGWFEDNDPIVRTPGSRGQSLRAVVPSGEVPASGTAGGAASGSAGSTPNYMDRTFIDQKIRQGFQTAYGRQPTQDEYDYWMGKMTTPDVFSDGITRQGWNPYWQDRLEHPGSSSSSVNAGTETIVPGVPQQSGSGSTTGSFTSPGASGSYPLASTGWTQQWNTPFQAPTGTDDPGYQFRMDQGTQALQRSAAAKGTLLTGGTLTGLATFSQGLASQEYDKAYDRALGQYQMAYGIWGNNQNNNWNRLNTLAGYGVNATNAGNSAASTYGANAGNNITGAANATAAGQAASGQAWGNGVSNLANIAGGAHTSWKANQTPWTETRGAKTTRSAVR